MMFFPMIITTSFMIFISNSWFSMWLVMEINMMMFIPMMIFNNNLNSEINMNYFLIQSFNSYIFITPTLIFNNSNYLTINLMLMIMYFSIITKMGMPPFYLWYLKILKNLNWNNLMILSTYQKIIPMIIINFLILNKFMIKLNFLMLTCISFYSSIKGLNLNNIKIILTYSTFIQISWMLILMNNNEIMLFNYFIIYMLIYINMFFMMNKFNIQNLNNLIYLKINNKIQFYYFMILILSLSSMPPTLGFLMKWISVQSIFFSTNFIVIFSMIMNSLTSMYFYMRINFFLMMNNFNINKNFLKFLNFNFKPNYKISIFNWFLMTLLLSYELM